MRPQLDSKKIIYSIVFTRENLKNIVFSPHIGSATASTRKRMAELAVENVVAAIAGRPMPFCVNPEVYRSR